MPKPLSAIMKKMAERLFADPKGDASTDAAAAALLLTHVAWNRAIGVPEKEMPYASFLKKIKAQHPGIWKELKSRNTEALIDELIEYKRRYYPNDFRKIEICGFFGGKIHVEWSLPPKAEPVKPKAVKGEFDQVFQFKITLLLEIKPPIWRQIQVAETYTFYDLHVAIQNAMGWTDSHMNQFEIVNPATQKVEILGYPDEDFGDIETIAAWERRIADYFSLDNRTCQYIYDMGDYWEHLIEFDDILPRETGVKYPVCLDGRRACPPEDCGGVPGYEDMVAALSSKNSRKKKEYLEWLGTGYQPEYFDPKKVRFENPKKRLKAVVEHA